MTGLNAHKWRLDYQPDEVLEKIYRLNAMKIAGDIN
jgi:hypothetical protein